MTAEEAHAIRDAIEHYCYPKVTCSDFNKWRERPHNAMADVERTIRDQLASKEILNIKDGLSNVLYWGHRRAGYYKKRVENFRKKVTDDALNQARSVFRALCNTKETGILSIAQLKLPEFRGISFLSKVRMFLDPENYVTLDLSLLKNLKSLRRHFDWKENATSIRPTERNEKAYREWARLCHRLAKEISLDGKKFSAAEVERGFFYLVDQGQVKLAEKIYSAANVGLIAEIPRASIRSARTQ